MLFFIYLFVFLLATGLKDPEKDKIGFRKQNLHFLCTLNIRCANFDPVTGIVVYTLQMSNRTLRNSQNNNEHQNHTFQCVTFLEASRFFPGHLERESGSSITEG